MEPAPYSLDYNEYWNVCEMKTSVELLFFQVLDSIKRRIKLAVSTRRSLTSDNLLEVRSLTKERRLT